MAVDTVRGYGAPGVRHLLVCRAFALAGFVRLLLPDALERERWPISAVHAAGLALVAWRGTALGWVLVAAGVGLAIGVGRDQLTQSGIHLAVALAALACHAGDRAGRGDRLARDLPLAVRGIVVATYTIAAFHKTNTGFLDPARSCASEGIAILADGWSLPALAATAGSPAWPVAVLVAEAGLAALLCVRPAWALPLGALVHIPFTFAFAPSFAFTMLAGYAAFLTEADTRHLVGLARRRALALVAFGAACGAASMARWASAHDDLYPFWSLKEGALWAALAALAAAAWTAPPGTLAGRGPWTEPPTGTRTVPLAALLALVLFNAATPYFGWQFHRAGAMLSNLRVDEECWNSLLVPASVRRADPYVRIDRADVGPPPGDAARDEEVEWTLWNAESLSRARDRWCATGLRPVRLAGRHAGGAFAVADLCDEASWPLPGSPRPRFRRFQENLSRDCRQGCIH